MNINVTSNSPKIRAGRLAVSRAGGGVFKLLDTTQHPKTQTLEMW